MTPSTGVGDRAAPIVCLIRDEPPLRYFANRIHEAHGVALVVLERPATGGGGAPSKALRALRAGGARALVRAAREKRRERAGHEATVATLDHRFGQAWRRLDPGLQVLESASVNDPEVVGRVREIGPVWALDHGTSIVRPPVLAEASVALNLHWGLSPYYRGTRCTQWALLNWDPFNIGVTVHELTQAIDGGGVIGQARARVGPDDTAHSINMQLTELGTEIIVDAVGRLAVGAELRRVEQDLSRGFLAYGAHWSDDLERHLGQLECDGSVGRMLQRPAREARLPIVEL